MFEIMPDDERNGSFKTLNDLSSPLGQSSGAHGGIAQTTPNECRESLHVLFKSHNCVEADTQCSQRCPTMKGMAHSNL